MVWHKTKILQQSSRDPTFFHPIIPCRAKKGIVIEIIGDTTIAGHFSRMIVYFPEPVGWMIHVRILIVHSGGHLPKHIAAVSQPFKITQHLLSLRCAAFTYNRHEKSERKSVKAIVFLLVRLRFAGLKTDFIKHGSKS